MQRREFLIAVSALLGTQVIGNTINLTSTGRQKNNELLLAWNKQYNFSPNDYLESRNYEFKSVAELEKAMSVDFANNETFNYNGFVLSKVEAAVMAMV